MYVVICGGMQMATSRSLESFGFYFKLFTQNFIHLPFRHSIYECLFVYFVIIRIYVFVEGNRMKKIFLLLISLLLVGCTEETNTLSADEFVSAFNDLSPDVRDNIIRVEDNDFSLTNGTLEEAAYFLNALKELLGDEVLEEVNNLTNGIINEGFYINETTINDAHVNITAVDSSSITIVVKGSD